MSKTKELLTSRKFWAAVSAAVLGIWGMAKGEVTTEVGIPAVMAVVTLWIHAQAKVDATKTPETPPVP